MVWDVDPIVFFHQTAQKEKVFISPPRNNREEIATVTASVQVQHASVTPPSPIATPSLILTLVSFFFFLIFSQKLRGRVTRNIEKKHMA